MSRNPDLQRELIVECGCNSKLWFASNQELTNYMAVAEESGQDQEGVHSPKDSPMGC